MTGWKACPTPVVLRLVTPLLVMTKSRGCAARVILLSPFLLVTAWASTGCVNAIEIPDQSQFAPLEEMAELDEAVARVYVAPVHYLGNFATHTWFVVKEAGSHDFDRWEVSLHHGEPYGYIYKNLREPEQHIGSYGVFVQAELIGEEAEPVVEFVENESPNYPCRDFYFFLPGPNCNTYGQWVLDNTGWDVDLPFTSLGKDAPVNCE
jgi:hypothetical protein